jgi:hypothetical protein
MIHQDRPRSMVRRGVEIWNGSGQEAHGGWRIYTGGGGEDEILRGKGGGEESWGETTQGKMG